MTEKLDDQEFKGTFIKIDTIKGYNDHPKQVVILYYVKCISGRSYKFDKIKLNYCKCFREVKLTFGCEVHFSAKVKPYNHKTNGEQYKLIRPYEVDIVHVPTRKEVHKLERKIYLQSVLVSCPRCGNNNLIKQTYPYRLFKCLNCEHKFSSDNNQLGLDDFGVDCDGW